jgi:hypothetical protein
MRNPLTGGPGAPGEGLGIKDRSQKCLLELERRVDSRVELTAGEIQVLLESLEYSIQRIRDAQGTPYPVRQENLQRLSSVQEKLRQIRKQLRD